MDKLEINIGLLGCVSVGKSSFLNAISGQHYSDAEIKKTTMVPQVYLETEENPSNPKIIRHTNREVNESVQKEIDLNKFTVNKCQPIYHNIDRICDLFDPEIIDPRLKINVYDIPGLNDSISKDIYFDWVRQNIKLFDIVIFMTDITKGLNNSDEIEILNLLMSLMQKYKFRMICLMNKCDDIYFDKEENDLVFEEVEQENIYIQANNILVDVAKKYGFAQGISNGEISDTQIQYFTPFYPLSAENCFIYQALMKNPLCELDQIHQNRLCKNECGANQWKKMTLQEKETMFKKIVSELGNTYNNKIMDTGYLAVKSIIQNTISDNKSQFIINHIENDIKELEVASIENVTAYVKLINVFIGRLQKAELFCGKKISYNIFWKNIKKTIKNYLKSINKINTKITKGKDFIDFKDFDMLHCVMQVHCINFSTLVETISNIPEYPEEFVMLAQKQIVDKLICIYEQLCNTEIFDHTHTCSTNLTQYLQVIKTYWPDKFNIYARKFLEISCKNIIGGQQLSNQNDFLELVLYISLNNKYNDDVHAIKTIICQFLNNKQQYIQNKFPDQYISYLVQMKKLIKNIIKTSPINSFGPFDLLLEITSKNISLYLNTNCVSNIYKQDINHPKITNLFNKFLGQEPEKLIIDMEFEKKLLNVFN